MKTKLKVEHCFGMTRVGVLATVISVLIVVAIGAIEVCRVQPRMNMIGCNGRLKCIGFAYRVWAGDNGDKFPIVALTNAAGGLLYTNGTSMLEFYKVMSNELCNPKILICPADKVHHAANSFSNFTGNSNMSYFIGAQATNDAGPVRFLSGDFNITNSIPLNNGTLELITNQIAGWTERVHNKRGNIGMFDGSVQQLGRPELNMAVARTGLATNRLLMPVY